MSFKSNGPISEPADSTQFTLHDNLDNCGFGWDYDQGLFIPTDGLLDYMQNPYQQIEDKLNGR